LPDTVNSRTISAISRALQWRSFAARASIRGASRSEKFGGISNIRSFSICPSREKYLSNSTYAAASFFENFAISSVAFSRSPHNVSEVPSGNGAQ
jgi:hypothetical protein